MAGKKRVPGTAARHTGTVPVKFGKTGNPVQMSQSKVDRAKAAGRHLYEDGTMGAAPKRRGTRKAR